MLYAIYSSQDRTTLGSIKGNNLEIAAFVADIKKQVRQNWGKAAHFEGSIAEGEIRITFTDPRTMQQPRTIQIVDELPRYYE